MIETGKPFKLALTLIFHSTFWAGTQPGRTSEIHARRRHAFSPAEITVRKGETVRLELISDDVPHSLQIKDLGLNETVTKGRPAEILLNPRQAGDFRGQCGRFCRSGHGQMMFAIHVTEG
jgi:cytochrome c oxidase subunit 2